MPHNEWATKLGACTESNAMSQCNARTHCILWPVVAWASPPAALPLHDHWASPKALGTHWAGQTLGPASFTHTHTHQRGARLWSVEVELAGNGCRFSDCQSETRSKLNGRPVVGRLSQWGCGWAAFTERESGGRNPFATEEQLARIGDWLREADRRQRKRKRKRRATQLIKLATLARSAVCIGPSSWKRSNLLANEFGTLSRHFRLTLQLHWSSSM